MLEAGFFADFWCSHRSAPAKLDKRTKHELSSLYVRMEGKIIRTIIEEAVAQASTALFVGMIAVWAGMLSSGW
jgi:hypothetical protein